MKMVCVCVGRCVISIAAGIFSEIDTVKKIFNEFLLYN